MDGVFIHDLLAGGCITNRVVKYTNHANHCSKLVNIVFPTDENVIQN